MAFNHSNRCDCPVGDCDCGTIYVWYVPATDEILIGQNVHTTQQCFCIGVF